MVASASNVVLSAVFLLLTISKWEYRFGVFSRPDVCIKFCKNWPSDLEVKIQVVGHTNTESADGLKGLAFS